MNRVHFSKLSDLWNTPTWLADLIRAEFPIALDVCATDEKNALAERYFTPEVDGLKQSWGGACCYMNPPYSENAKWMKKAWEESQKGATVVALVPARVDTRWWFDYALKATEIRFLKGRLKFSGSKNSAPFPSALVIFTPGKHTPKIRFVDLSEVQRSLFDC
jgi:phage N-6-adenine-methyltransferase